jgi:hypothetical protein
MDEMDYITVEEFQPFGDPSLIIAVESQPPTKPEIDGPINGNIGVEYEWTFVSTDSDGDNISYYIDWGDKSGEGGWFGPYPSGEKLFLTHEYKSKNNFTIKAMAVDEYGVESSWAYFEVSMPRSKIANISLLNFLFNHPNILSIVQWFLQKLEYNI